MNPLKNLTWSCGVQGEVVTNSVSQDTRKKATLNLETLADTLFLTVKVSLLILVISKSAKVHIRDGCASFHILLVLV